MPKYRVTVRVSDLTGDDPASVQRGVEEKLKSAGVEGASVVSVEAKRSKRARMRAARRKRREREARALRALALPPASGKSDSGGLTLVAAAAVILWLVWYALE